MWRRRKQDERAITLAERVTAPLRKNMPNAGDFSYEAIRKLGNPIPMLVQNNGDKLLELWLEPLAED